MSASGERASLIGQNHQPSNPSAEQPDFPDRTRRLAVLIDAENASHRTIPDLIATIETHGAAVIRRAYGDWGSTSLDAWRSVLGECAIRPIQCGPIRAGTGRGRNATDIALVVDAMDLLHTRPLEGFCIVSSDSDFTDLALRIREAGLMVIGVGRTATPSAFKASCTRFIAVDPPKEARPPPPPKARPAAGEATTATATADSALSVCLDKALMLAARNPDGWARIKDVKKNLPTSHRSGNLVERVQALGKAYQVRQMSPATGQPIAHCLRRTPQSTG